MDFLMVDVWIYYMWPTAESYDLRSSRELRGFLLDFAVGHPKLETMMKEVRVKHWYDMDAFNTSFVFLENSALFST